jgi:hypothetical protein
VVQHPDRGIKKSTLKTSLEELGILRKCPTSSNHS